MQRVACPHSGGSMAIARPVLSKEGKCPPDGQPMAVGSHPFVIPDRESESKENSPTLPPASF